jgi:hypothetical protein
VRLRVYVAAGAMLAAIAVVSAAIWVARWALGLPPLDGTGWKEE